MVNEVDPWTVEGLAERWKVNHATVRKMINTGQLECFRVGQLIRIRHDEVLRFEAEHKEVGK